MVHSNLFRLFKNTFLVIGIWDDMTLSKYRRILYNLYCFCVIGPFFVFLIGGWSNIGEEISLLREEPRMVVLYGGCVMSVALTSIKLIFSKTKVIRNLLTKMFLAEEEIYSSSNVDIQEIHKSAAAEFMVIMRLYLMFSFFTAAGMWVTTIYLIMVDGYVGCDLSVSACERFYPFGVKVFIDYNEHYAAVITILCVVNTSAVTVMFCTDTAFVSLILSFTCEIKALQFALENFLRFAKEDEGGAFAVVRQCAIKHQQIIRNFNELNQALGPILFIDFFLHTIEVALFMVFFMTGKPLFDFFGIFMLASLSLVFAQLVIIYWPGQLLILESMKISDAIYNSKWFEADSKTCKCLLLIMMRSQQYLALSIGPLYEVDLTVFLKIMKAIYSYVTYVTSRV